VEYEFSIGENHSVVQLKWWLWQRFSGICKYFYIYKKILTLSYICCLNVDKRLLVFGKWQLNQFPPSVPLQQLPEGAATRARVCSLLSSGPWATAREGSVSSLQSLLLSRQWTGRTQVWFLTKFVWQQKSAFVFPFWSS